MSRFASFREFYPFYLGEHQNRTCRRLHFAGSSLALGFVLLAVLLDRMAQAVLGARQPPR